ncbi:MAG: molybdopterin-dependent oxidoreductase [Planctomycetes bacterium]|nr:molybdopterin-dependent oxidoreductase [Planctomycetota bacterium]
MQIDRREFLKTSAMAAAAAMILPALDGAEGATPADDGIRWDKAPCRFCGTGCGVLLGVKDGRIVAMQADKQASVNKGLCCVKGYHVGLILYGQDRLTTPMKRVDGKLVPISWEEAIAIIRDRIAAAPDRFAMYGSGQWTIPEGYAANKFVKGGLGHNHIDPNARLCMASAAAGFNATYGVDEPAGCYDDLDHCTVLISWGNNPAEMHPVLFSRAMDRRLKGDKLLFIDLTTRRTRSSEQADHVAFFKPNSDLAVANGIAHLLVKKGFLDKPWVEKHFRLRQRVAEYAPDPAKRDVYDPDATHLKNLAGKDISREEYARNLDFYTPEKVEEISGVPADLIRLIADKMADPAERVLSWWCMGPNQHTRGTAMNSLLHSIHHLSGQWGKPGASAFSLTGQPSACGTAREVGTFVHLLPGHLPVLNPHYREVTEEMWHLPKGRISDKLGFHTVKMWDEFCKEGGAIDTIWVQVTNPGQTLPHQNKLFLAKKDRPGKFLIVSDVYPTATTALADLVLPSAMYVEKNGMYGNAERKQQQWFKMVDPPGQARPDAWQVLAVAKALFDAGFPGMKDKDGEWIFARTFKQADGGIPPIWDFAHYYDINVDKALFEEYRPFTKLKHKDLAPYDVYVQAHGLRWPVIEKEPGKWEETLWRFVEGKDPYVKPGSGLQFYHSNTKDDKAFIWWHPYEAAPEEPDADYPFWLCTGRVLEHWHSGSMTMRVPPLRRSMPHAYIELHPDDAAALGVKSGDKVTVESRRGSLTLPAWIKGRGQPPKGSCFVPFFDERLQINLVTKDYHDPFSKQPDFKKCAVRLRKA